MPALPVLVFVLVQALALFLFAAGAAAFAALLKGCFVLRRMERGATRDEGAVLLKSPLVPAVSVVAAPRDASAETRGFIRRLLGLHFGQPEVVVVLDGPSAADLDLWTEEFHLVPSNRPADRGYEEPLPAAAVRRVLESRDPLRLVVLEKEHGGESDALNAAVNAAAGSVIAIFDRQSEFAPDALLRMVRPLLENPEGTVAVCGVAPAPAGPGWAARFAAIEAVRLWLVRCAAFAGWRMLLPVPGSTVLVPRDAIRKAGGFTAGAVELVLQLHGLERTRAKPRAVAFVPAPVSWLPPPADMADLREWIRRDQHALGRAFVHRESLELEGKVVHEGAIGWGLPALFGMRLLRPLAETALYPLTVLGLILGWVPLPLAGTVLLATVGMGIVISMAAVVLRELAQYRGCDPEQLSRLFLAAIPENLGYRQVRNLWLIGAFLEGMRTARKERRQRPAKRRAGR